jgi:hypothetical protein
VLLELSNKNKLQKFSNFYKEVKRVYGDCNQEFQAHRQLSYCSKESVCIDTSIDILNNSMVGYNNFFPNILEHLKEIDKNGKVYIARENSVCIYFQSNLDESEKKIVEHLENNSYSSCGLHKFYGSTIKLNNKIQKTIKSSFQTSSSVSNKMLVDECNLVLISSSGRLYNACEGNSYIICVSNNIFPDVIPLTPNTKIYRFWWD